MLLIMTSLIIARITSIALAVLGERAPKVSLIRTSPRIMPSKPESWLAFCVKPRLLFRHNSKKWSCMAVAVGAAEAAMGAVEVAVEVEVEVEVEAVIAVVEEVVGDMVEEAVVAMAAEVQVQAGIAVEVMEGEATVVAAEEVTAGSRLTQNSVLCK